MEELNPLPPRAALRPPEDAPVAGRQRESLVGRTVRTCECNQLSVSAVIVDSFIPDRWQTARGFQDLRGMMHQINSGNTFSKQWAATLRNLTGSSADFSGLMLSSVTEPLGLPRLLCSRYKKWCPICYASDVDTPHGPYQRLLWCVEAVSVCPGHGVELVDTCPSCSRNRIPTISGKDTSGFCAYCHARLGGKGRFIDSQRDDYGRYIISTSTQLAELFDLKLASPINAKSNIQVRLRRLAEHHFGGRIIEMGLALDRPKSTISYWMNGRCSPSWNALLQVSYVFRVPLVDLVSGRCSAPISEESLRQLPHLVATRGIRKEPVAVDLPKLVSIVERLERGLISVHTISAVAKRIGSSTKQVRKTVEPKLYGRLKSVIETRRDTVTAADREHSNRRMSEEVDKIARLAAKAGEPVTRRALTARLALRGVHIAGSKQKALLKRAKELQAYYAAEQSVR